LRINDYGLIIEKFAKRYRTFQFIISLNSKSDFVVNVY